MKTETQSGLTHLDHQNQPTMVDISQKVESQREAVAQSTVIVPAEVVRCFDGKEIQSKKGPVFQTAIIAGTQAVKQTSQLIPFCHPLPLESCRFEIQLVANEITISCTVRAHYKTGVEMEALVGCSIAALTIYDMCKALSHKMIIQETKLVRKSGGKSDFVSSP